MYQKKCNLPNFKPMFHFYTPWKRQKTSGFLMFSLGIEKEHWTIGSWCKNKKYALSW